MSSHVTTSPAQRGHTRKVIPLAPAQTTKAIDSDVLIFLAFIVAVVTGVWAVNGGWDEAAGGWSHAWRASASYSGLLTSLAAMVGLILATRLPWMERSLGLDRILVWHRIAGDTMGIVLGVHVFTSVMAEMPLRGGFVNTIKDFTGREPYMAMTTIGALIVGVVVVSSLKSIRQQLSYETWYFVHLTAYIGIVLSYSHQITLGSLLSGDKLIRWFWGILSGYVLLLVILGRWSGVVMSIRRPLRVEDVRQETDDSVSVVLGGRNLQYLAGEAGQFVMLRILRPGMWWTSNPYSLSSAPTTAGLRITIRNRGDASAAAGTLRKGDRVAVEGPYGIATPDIFRKSRPLFVAGGVGVTPVRALLERLPQNSRPMVLIRARSIGDIPHYNEIVRLAESRGGEVRTVTGRTVQLRARDPFSPKALRSVVPDLTKCTAFICGPRSLIFSARKGLVDAGMTRDRIHFESAWW